MSLCAAPLGIGIGCLCMAFMAPFTERRIKTDKPERITDSDTQTLTCTQSCEPWDPHKHTPTHPHTQL